MKVFLSWSGEASQAVATALHNWLPYMHHAIKPFMSSADINAGDKWRDDLSHELRDAQYGIVCVTPFNVHKPWMNFEAGALAHLPHLAPFLFRLERGALSHSPLTQFQLTEFSANGDRSKGEFYKLIEGVNSELVEEERLASEVLETNFDHWWSELKSDLDAIPDTSRDETRTAYKWLRTFEDLAIHDLKPDCSTVWFVTADVFKYALRAGIREKLEANHYKVQYRYLIPDPAGSDERAARDQLENLKRAHPGRVDYRCLKRDAFENQAVSDYVIIESNLPEIHDAKVFVRVPIAGTEAEYWFDTEERAAVGFYHRFVQLWNCPANMVHVPAEEPFQTTAASG
jgi:hypothetical protein